MQNRRVVYIMRKAQSNYYSIEGLFLSISSMISSSISCDIFYAKHSGASPKTIINNLKTFNKEKNTIYHITGDVHYMALVSGKRTVLTIHDIGSALKGSFFKKLYVKLFWFWLPALIVKKITVISEFTKKELQRLIPFAKHKIYVVPNPVSDKFKPSPYVFNNTMPTILVLGTKVNKNIDRIFEAVNQINCQLHIIGSLSDDHLLKLKQLNLVYQNSIHLSHDDIVKAYNDCDLLCFPSTYEGFGMPIVEAQAVGRPVITSNTGAMLEVAKQSACLVNPFDIDEITKAIKRVIEDKLYREELIALGFENIKRFSIDEVTSKYMKIYKEMDI